MKTDYAAPFDYRPVPREWKQFDRMIPFPNKRQEKAYELWREDMIFRNYGPQNKPTWKPSDVWRLSQRKIS